MTIKELENSKREMCRDIEGIIAHFEAETGLMLNKQLTVSVDTKHSYEALAQGGMPLKREIVATAVIRV